MTRRRSAKIDLNVYSYLFSHGERSARKNAWGISLVAKESQALLIAITHNLPLCYEQHLEDHHDVQNTAEDERRSKRLQSAERTCAQIGWSLSPLVLAARRATQRSVKFIRWLRHAIRERLAEAAAVPRLRELYAAL